MSELSDFLEANLLDHMLGTSAYTSPSNVYLALYSSAPNDAGGGTELSGDGYARVAVTFSAAAAGSTSNPNAVTFATATDTWSQAVAVGILDASTSGNLLAYSALDSNVTVGSGSQFRFAASSVTVSLA